jgi:peptidoglycan/xylan/chitin deacetylase (PgdA/CDA1 family)/SAM-dependent methyltransferase
MNVSAIIPGHNTADAIASAIAALRARSSPTLKYQHAAECAGLMLGSGEDARPLLNLLEDERAPELAPVTIAESIFESATIPTCALPSAWVELWPEIEPRLTQFLQALEAQSCTPLLARRAQIILERLIVEHTTERPLTVGTTHAIRVEVTAPLPEVVASAERLHCTVECEGKPLGTLELPVCDGRVTRYVLADAIAAEFAWPILGCFFEHGVYRELSVEWEPTGLLISRGALRLWAGLPNKEAFWPQAQNWIGWTVFLQEIWGRPDWPSSRFYDPQSIDEPAPTRQVEDGQLTVEISEELPNVETTCAELEVILAVGGAAIGSVIIPVKNNRATAQELRAALTTATGFELCRAGVREALLGQSFRRWDNSSFPFYAGKPLFLNMDKEENGQVILSHLLNDSSLRARLGAAAKRRNDPALPANEQTLVLGRRSPTVFGASASRRAVLPAATASELIEAAAIFSEPVIFEKPKNETGRSLKSDRSVESNGRLQQIIYTPEVIVRSSASLSPMTTTGNELKAQQPQPRAHDRAHFETLFAKQPDPWKYTSAYEQTKYEQTLSLLPPEPIERALELACAEGHFTIQLAPRVNHLLATDISQIALDRTAERCASMKNIEYQRLDLVRDALPGRFNLIVCSEVLYYVGGLAEMQTVARKIAEALEPGGCFLTAHAHAVVDEPDRPGFDWDDFPFGAKVIGEVFASTPPLQLVRELRTPLYRIQLFQRVDSNENSSQLSDPQIIELAEQPVLPTPEVAAHIRWHGGQVHRSNAPEIVTRRLPILMYHRVAPAGSTAMARYRVTPEAFETQLQYLHETGYYSITLDEWQTAVFSRRPLPGRAILLTFDDGHWDFLTHAWPLLQRYGFSATVFLVADQIGRTNAWDQIYGEELPLLGWEEIRELQAAGVEFGSHSASHRHLTGLSSAEIVREAIRSRAVLERGLGIPVRAFAYPYGAEDRVVQHLIGACGYVFGLSCRPGPAGFQSSLLALPRIEITGFDTLREFVTKLVVD